VLEITQSDAQEENQQAIETSKKEGVRTMNAILDELSADEERIFLGTLRDAYERGFLSNVKRISTRQALAAACLALGTSVSKTARIVGRDRKTITRWKNQPHVQRVLQTLKLQSIEAAQQQLAAAIPLATEKYIQEIKDGSVDLAVKLLEKTGVLGPFTNGSAQGTDAEPQDELDRALDEQGHQLNFESAAEIRDRLLDAPDENEEIGEEMIRQAEEEERRQAERQKRETEEEEEEEVEPS